MTSAPSPSIRPLGHVPAFDSVRAVAVTLVLCTHLGAVLPFLWLDARWTRSGFLGVHLFFVLSGFLITSLLLREQHDSGRIRLRHFYARRALRLLPALVFFLVAYIAYSHLSDWPPFGRRDFAFDSIEATLLYYMNWRVLWNPLGAADLTAIWSLSIEEQFYLAWPLLLLAFVGWRHRGDRVTWIIGGAAVAVTVWRAIAFRRWGWEAAYLRTDTSVDGLLWGALTASLFARRRTPECLPRWTPWAVGAIWVALLLWVKADGGSAYYGGITLWVLSSCVLVLYLASAPEAGTTGWLAAATRKLGRVSYAVYLWQLPVFRAVERWGEAWSTAGRVAAALLLLGACTLASWFLVEQPVLRLKRRLEARWRAADPALTA